MKKRKERSLRAFLFVLPLILGAAGFLMAGERLLDALFKTVTMYVLNYGDTPSNVLVQLARWTAPVATASGVILLFTPVVKGVQAWIRYRRGDSVAVYGDEALCEQLRRSGHRVILGADRLLPAQRYVLFGPEEDNLRFLMEHREELKERDVYLKCRSLRSQELGGSRLHLYCPEEVGARLFWRQAELWRQFTPDKPELSIALVGFGRLGEELLLCGLQNNVFSRDQRIRYDVFGEADSFRKLHHELHRVNDPVVFHGDWKEDLPLLQSADRILVCRQDDQLLLLEELLFALDGKTLDVLTAEPSRLLLLEAQDRLRVFAWKEAALRPENLFDDKTLELARAINLRYAHVYDGVEENPENARKEWDKLNSFTRYSNISAADYHEIRLQTLRERGLTKEQALSDPDCLEELAELEHTRWERFHYLNNWHYGKSKDPALRTHCDLIPYDKLSDAEREKDRENVRLLLGL